MNKSVTKQKVKPCRLTTKETPIASCEVMVVDVIYRIAVQGIFVGIVIKAGVASLKVTDLLTCCQQVVKVGGGGGVEY